MRFLAPAIAVSAFAAPSAGTSSFSGGCMPIDAQFYEEDTIGFYCQTEQVAYFQYAYSTIDLRHCLGNDNGELIGHEDGSYHETCKECTLISFLERSIADVANRSTCYLKCSCLNLDGEAEETAIDLDDVVGNDNGRLVCYGHEGTKESAPPKCHHDPDCVKEKMRKARESEESEE